MHENPWFEIDEPDEEITQTDQAFLALLRARTAPFAAIESDDEIHGRAERFDGALAAYLSLGDPDEPRHLVDFGVHFFGDRVRGDRLHNQFPALTDPPTNWQLDATGTIEELADMSADWFSAILRKPVLLYVWLNADRYAYAARFAFADINQTLIQCYNKQLAPPGQAEELIAAGHVHGTCRPRCECQSARRMLPPVPAHGVDARHAGQPLERGAQAPPRRWLRPS